nr:helix-turn-helix domain-containing protein [bacterium]
MEAQDIRTLRKKLGLSQRQFAKRLGVSKRTVAYWESGKSSPGEEMLNKLAELPVTSDEEMNNESVKSGEEVKSKSVKSGEEVNSESVKSGEEVKSKSVKSGEEVKSESVKNDEEVKSESVKNDEEVNSESVKSDEEVKSDENVTTDGNDTNQTDPKASNPEVLKQATDNPDDAKNNPHEPSDEPHELEDEPKLNPHRNRKAGKRRSPFVQSVLDQIPIEGEIGKDVQLKHSSKKFSGLCPFHNDTNPSFEVYPHTQSWFCYGCQKGGSLIDYVMYRDSVTPAEAIRRLCETYNIPQPSWTKEQRTQWEKTKQEKELISEINLDVFKWYHDQMPQERREYYLRRGIIDGTIDKELLGYAPLNDAIVGELLKSYKAEQLVSSGLFTVVSGCLEPIYQRRYVMPYWEDGKIVYSIGRLDTNDPDEIAQLPEWNRGKYKKQLTHSEKHPKVSKVVKNVIWNADCVGDYETGSIAEGIIDGMLHKQISDEIGVGVISPVTTKFSSHDLEQLINLTEQWEKVYCISDNEVSEAGIKGAVSTAKTLFLALRNPYIVLPPRPDDVEKVDLADYLNVPKDQKETRTKEFSQLLSSSPPLLDYLISEAKSLSDKKERNETITQIIGLMIDINPLELEDYKDTLEEELGVKRGVFKSLFDTAKKKKEKEERQQAQEELNQRTVNVDDGTPDDDKKRRYGDVMETEEGYVQVSFSPTLGMKVENISSFLIKPKSRLWIDDYEAVSTDLVTANGKTYSAIFERHHWNELNAFMSRLPSIDLVWQGKLQEVQAVMGMVNSYSVPVQKGTRQIGWHERRENELVWVSKDINFATDGFLDPPEVLYCPYSGEI